MKLSGLLSYPFSRWVLTLFAVAASFLRVAGQEGAGSARERPGAVQGRIRDSTLDRNCPLVVVAILHPDSTLAGFARSRKDGSWVIRGIPAGRYFLLMEHPGYTDWTGRVVVRRDSVTDLGTIYLQPRSDTLAAVVVTPRNPPMHLRGDTLEYNTANVKMKMNATVEELLARLPGVQIDQNGGITVNGVKVEHLLVDGEDFFGGDPTIVTKNFNAEMIAKIQFLDKKSSQAEFTGVDDGQRTKTVNLVLKEDSKKGYFVKGEAGAGQQGYNDVNGMVGAFRGPRQLAILAMTANNGTTGVSGEGAGLSIGGGASDALGGSAGGGIPQAAGAGAHYADKWNGNMNHFSGNGSFGFLTTRPYSSSITQQTLPDSVYTQVQQANSSNTANRQHVNADYDLIPDTVQTFRLSIGAMKAAGNDRYASTASSAFNDTLVNSSVSTIRAVARNENLDGNLMWRIKGRKVKARNFSITARVNEQTNNSQGYLYVLNHFFRPDGNLLAVDTTDQRKGYVTTNLALNSSLNFTEPLWRNTVLAVRYNVNFNRSESSQSTFGRGDGKYAELVDSLSNHYRNDVFSQASTINIQSNGKPVAYTIGGDLLQYSNRQEDVLKDSVLKYRYVTLNPRVNGRYAIGKNQGISFTYSANRQQPSITQLQPVQNNNNPLFITLGNPDLRSSFSQHFGVGFDMVKPVFFSLGVNYGYVSNAISTRVHTDSLGRQISQAVNVSGSEYGGVNFNINHKVMPVGVDLGANGNFSVNRNVSYVGDLLSNNDAYNAGGGVSIGKYLANRYSFRVSTNAGYSYSVSSVNRSLTTSFWTQNDNFELSYFILPGLELNSTGYYVWHQKTSVFDKDNAVFLWNAFVARNFLQNRLVVKWRVNDILGENAGVGRSISGNVTTQTASNIVGRYLMISVSYRFIRHGRLK